MSHPQLQQIIDFEIVKHYTLRITFSDGVEQTINCEPVLHGALYGPLRDLELFNQVRLDPEWNNLIWPNDADFDPANLYNWPAIEGDFIAWAHALQTTRVN